MMIFFLWKLIFCYCYRECLLVMKHCVFELQIEYKSIELISLSFSKTTSLVKNFFVEQSFLTLLKRRYCKINSFIKLLLSISPIQVCKNNRFH